MNKYWFKVEKYKSASSELLINNATIAENSSTRPLAASNLKNHLLIQNQSRIELMSPQHHLH